VLRRNSQGDEAFHVSMMRRHLCAAAAAAGAALALPAAASAQLIEVGSVPTEATPSCPRNPCLAVSRTTGYQAKVGERRGLMVIPSNGRIVAWTIKLARPGRRQIEYFNSLARGEAMAQITILRTGRRLRARTVAQGEPRRLEPFFGTTVQFALERSIPVRKGQLLALTVPTWAPALAVGLGADTSWRASRARGTCDDTREQTAQTEANQLAQYFCLYRTARLTYSATLVTRAQRANPPRRTTRTR
jgi:hypothetical protein